jgi:23S rRNA (uracil1939-C5)-methyltransferase
LTVDFDRLAYGGEAVGRHEGMVVFALGIAPHETARVRVTRVHRRHIEAEPVAILRRSPDRVPARCPHFDQGCGGCSWQHLGYESQLAAKATIVRDSLERLGNLKDPPMLPIMGAPSPWFYRNKMEFAFHPEGLLGLHPRGAWHRILPLETCFLESELAVRIVKAAQAFVARTGISLYHPRKREGFLRELMIRHSQGTGQTMLAVVTSPGPFPLAQEMAKELAAIDPGIISLIHCVRASTETAAPLDEAAVLHGQDHITEVVDGLHFRIGTRTFFQTNTAQAERMVQVVREMCGPLPGALVIDVYCGVGLFSLALAKAAHKVVGVEVVEAAVVAARANAAANTVPNTEFYAGDARKVLPDVLATHGAPDVIVLDPPRAGAGGKVMRRIARSAPRRIVYVSCNPTTLARDLTELKPFGYQVTAVQPIDLFPQTYHVETIVALERTDTAAPLPSPSDNEDAD